MLVNNNYSTETAHVEFVSYTGRFPNLCGGVLTLKIDGEEVCFGHDYTVINSWKTDGNYSEFWCSGGGLDSDYCSYQNEWEINVEKIPEEYRKYASEIDYIFNSNVPYGCCGGCA